jgi:PAS domain S-box-containing protein
MAEHMPSLEILRQIVADTHEGVLVIDRESKITYANKRIAEIVDRKPEELIGQNAYDLIAPNSREEWLKHLEARRQGVREEYEITLIGKDGNPIGTAVSAMPLYDEQGQWMGSAGMIRDVRLTQSRTFLDSLIENIPNMVFVKDAKDLRFVRFNKAGEDLLGLSRVELLGKNDFDLFPQSQAEFFIKKDREVLAGTAIVDIPEEPLRSQIKGERVLHTKKIPVLGKDGKPEYLLGIAEDITERKLAEEERMRIIRQQAASEERERASREFLTIASHELKTPMTSLRIQLQMAIRNLTQTGQLPSVEKLKKVLDTSALQVDRLTRLIEDLLDVSRIQSGKLSFHLENVDLSALMLDVLERYREPLEAANCVLDIHIDDTVTAVIDRGRIEQVIVNLISNVLKYAPEAPLTVSLSKVDHLARIEVEDRGPGIELQMQSRIFERFGRASSSRHIAGLGLGLFISQQIVEAHGGKIRVESEPGRGSRFVILLPLKPTNQPMVDKSTYTAESVSEGYANDTSC